MTLMIPMKTIIKGLPKWCQRYTSPKISIARLFLVRLVPASPGDYVSILYRSRLFGNT